MHEKDTKVKTSFGEDEIKLLSEQKDPKPFRTTSYFRNLPQEIINVIIEKLNEGISCGQLPKNKHNEASSL